MLQVTVAYKIHKGHEAAEALAALRSDDSEAFEGDCYPTKPYKTEPNPSAFKLSSSWFSWISPSPFVLLASLFVFVFSSQNFLDAVLFGSREGFFLRDLAFSSIWVCLKMLCTPKPNGFADHDPYEKWLFHWEYTQHFQTNPSFPFLSIKENCHARGPGDGTRCGGKGYLQRSFETHLSAGRGRCRENHGSWMIYGFVWKCWVNIPNEIAIFHRDNDQQNHWVQWGTLFSDTPILMIMDDHGILSYIIIIIVFPRYGCVWKWGIPWCTLQIAKYI